MTVKVVKDSHVDHGLTEAQLDWLLSQFKDRDGFFIETVELPEELGTVPCGLYGPTMGDDPVPAIETWVAARNGRAWASRLCDRPLRPVRQVTVIAGPHGDEPMVLYTAFGGPVAPREPGDTSMSNEERAKSQAFWDEHALSGQ
jgi:hypothetical protein